MHTEMWLHPATQDNVATLRRRGDLVLDPGIGRLTGSDSGVGRLPEPAEIFRFARRVLGVRRGGNLLDLAGRTVVVSAGGTREHLDPVRFLGNRSSGRQGYALAEAARDRGASVVLLTAHLDVPPPRGVQVRAVGTTRELAEAVAEHAPSVDTVIMAAAVADYRP